MTARIRPRARGRRTTESARSQRFHIKSIGHALSSGLVEVLGAVFRSGNACPALSLSGERKKRILILQDKDPFPSRSRAAVGFYNLYAAFCLPPVRRAVPSPICLASLLRCLA